MIDCPGLCGATYAYEDPRHEQAMLLHHLHNCPEGSFVTRLMMRYGVWLLERVVQGQPPMDEILTSSEHGELLSDFILDTIMSVREDVALAKSALAAEEGRRLPFMEIPIPPNVAGGL